MFARVVALLVAAVVVVAALIDDRFGTTDVGGS